MANKKAQYNVDNGSGYDTFHFETSEDMLVDIKQSFEENGYRKLPGGLILQWGRTHISGGKETGFYTITYPIVFPHKVFNVMATAGGTREVLTTCEVDGVVDDYLHRKNNFDVHITKVYAGNGFNVNWFAIGF